MNESTFTQFLFFLGYYSLKQTFMIVTKRKGNLGNKAVKDVLM